MQAKNLVQLAAAILLCQAAGAFGAIFTAPAIPTWYASLAKPFFTPPSFVFAPVWVTLYTLMGAALYLVWRQGTEKHGVRPAIAVFGVQLALNAAWSFLFFGLRDPMLAFVEIGLLWAAIIATIYKFYPVSRKAAALLVPYLAWVSLAAALNYSVWVLNA